jgi:hypothetical protein
MADTRSREGAGWTTQDQPTSAASRDSSAFNFRERSSDEGLPDLIRKLTEQGSQLAQQQVQLIETEVRSGINDIKQSAGAMAGAAVLGLAGTGVLLMGISFLLNEVMPLWAATLIVAVATLAGAYMMFAAGQKKLQSSSFSAERTRRTLERAPSAISGNEDRTHGR